MLPLPYFSHLELPSQAHKQKHLVAIQCAISSAGLCELLRSSLGLSSGCAEVEEASDQSSGAAHAVVGWLMLEVYSGVYPKLGASNRIL